VFQDGLVLLQTSLWS